MLGRKMPLSRDAAKLRMADLCARSEQCEGEIMQKLLKAGLSSGDARSVVEELVGARFIDNGRYARAYARDKVRFAGWGRRKIAAGLMAKRIDSSTVREALAEIDSEDYSDALERAARGKARGLDLQLANDRLRLLRHLASRGFEGGIASAVVDRLRREAADEDS